MRNVLWLAAFAACGSVSALAQTLPDPALLEVRGSTEVASWTEDVGRKLDSAIRYPRGLPEWDIPEGTVTVTFRRGGDGRAKDIAVVDRSGDPSLVAAARSAVARLEGIGPLPGPDGSEQTVRANIVFAATEESLDQQMAVVRSKEAARLARENGKDQRTLVLQLNPRSRG